MSPSSRARDKSHSRNLLAKALRTNGAEKVHKGTVPKPDAMAARKKVKGENETLDDLEQNEDERGYQPLLKTNSEAADRIPSRTADVLRRLDPT
jgi:hypothetical protein